MPDINLAPNTWTDIYAESGIAVGTQINVQSSAGGIVYVKTANAEPADKGGATRLASLFQAQNKVGSPGEWAYSLVPAIISVSEV